MDPEFLRDLFREFGTIQVRRMFSGAGLFADGVMFALVSGGIIYLKADDASIPLFKAENAGPFSYCTKVGRRALTSYWRLPERLYDDPDELAQWAGRALTIARSNRKAAGKSRPQGKAKRRKA